MYLVILFITAFTLTMFTKTYYSYGKLHLWITYKCNMKSIVVSQ